MEAYSISLTDGLYSGDALGYYRNKKKAIEVFNKTIRDVIKSIGGDIVDKEDFSEAVSDMKLYDDCKIVCRKYPIIITEREGLLNCHIFYWYKCSYEYNEYDKCSRVVSLNEIFIF